MFVCLKKSTAIATAISFLMVCFAVAIISFMLSYDITAEENQNVTKTIVIDPGHGGIDGGATAGDLLEKDLNLSVALKIEKVLNENGYSTALTRNNDEIKLNENGKYSKTIDLKSRLELINENNADIFVSIHMNKFSDPKYSGAQVFCADNDMSKALGEKVQNSLKIHLDSSNTRAAKGNERSLYILKNASVPAVLIECGFMSNPDELKLLTDSDYQEKIAYAVYKGIEEYILGS